MSDKKPVVETKTQHSQITDLLARIKVLETGISKAIDTCECRNQPGPNSCQRCRGLIRLLEGD
jgi:hypothetical protein